jgi:hypothetical protein
MLGFPTAGMELGLVSRWKTCEEELEQEEWQACHFFACAEFMPSLCGFWLSKKANDLFGSGTVGY